ncbi:NAD(P)-dependent glycerol-1-phosphate dehydrogenase [Staphylothermus hellenicus]|uniref:NAD(P)-dependent glycerol-1-phosphate dehydrogenase n=1 Tax=Staphylothermus hellenicus TaxID=84599 RepID=UPI00069A4960|nr:NAD(P)-dependent glycerol-1-phosphate dehydrogenase [Staphylothermus hellenicus]
MLDRSIHEITLPLKVIIGSGILDKIPDYLSKMKFTNQYRAGIITGPTTYNVAGRIVEESLKNNGYNVEVWKARDARMETANQIVEETKTHSIKIFLGVGGGKSIDLAKYAAYKNNGYMISVPTAASHDGIASPFASLKGTDKPTSTPTTTPYAIIADIDVISKAPPQLIRAGVGDLLGKLTAVKDWQLAHRLKGEYYGEYAAQLALLSAKHVIRYHELIASGNPDGIRIVVEALISSGVAMCIAGSSRPASGSEHLFSHALDLLAPGKALHGEQVALGTIMMLYLYGDPKWKKIKRIMKKIGLPTTAEEIGIPIETIVKALTIAHKIRPNRYTILGEKGLTEEAAWRLVRETGII